MQGVVQQLMGRVYGNPNGGITQFFSNYQINVPQLYANVDRTKAKQMGVSLSDVYETMQTYLGSPTSTTSTASAAPSGDRAGRRALPRPARTSAT